MARTLRYLAGSWEERQAVVSWHLRRCWRDRERFVRWYMRGVRADTAVALSDLREWWTPGENRVITVVAIAGAVVVGVLISLV